MLRVQCVTYSPSMCHTLNFLQQKVALVRAYAYLSALVFLIVVAIGLIRTVIHFSSKVSEFWMRF
jgi:hypothetical protein